MTSPEDLATDLDRLAAEGLLAGWVAGLADADDQTVLTGGHRSLGGPPMSEDTQFALSSSTKPFAGVLTLRLAEIGVLSLDDPVARWLPELATPRVLSSPGADLDDTRPADRAITVADLLGMVPGFGWVAEPGPLADAIAAQPEIAPGPWGPPLPPDEFVARIAALPLADQPGTAWRYHTSSDVLSVLLARATDESVGHLLTEHVLGPLGLTDTAFHGDPDRMATAYGAPGPDEPGLAPFPVPPGTYVDVPVFESLAAGLVSTVPDQLTFLSSLVGSSPAVLSPASLGDLRTDHLTTEQRRTATGFLQPGCGWGRHVEIRPEGWIGWAGGLGTIGYADPATGRAAFLATQVSFDAGGTSRAFDRFWGLLASAG